MIVRRWMIAAMLAANALVLGAVVWATLDRRQATAQDSITWQVMIWPGAPQVNGGREPADPWRYYDDFIRALPSRGCDLGPLYATENVTIQPYRCPDRI